MSRVVLILLCFVGVMQAQKELIESKSCEFEDNPDLSSSLFSFGQVMAFWRPVGAVNIKVIGNEASLATLKMNFICSNILRGYKETTQKNLATSCSNVQSESDAPVIITFSEPEISGKDEARLRIIGDLSFGKDHKEQVSIEVYAEELETNPVIYEYLGDQPFASWGKSDPSIPKTRVVLLGSINNRTFPGGVPLWEGDANVLMMITNHSLFTVFPDPEFLGKYLPKFYLQPWRTTQGWEHPQDFIMLTLALKENATKYEFPNESPCTYRSKFLKLVGIKWADLV